jgi:threonyl-tRNA synthetase
MVIVGEKEEKDGTVSVRKHGEGDIGTFTIKEFISLIKTEESKTLKKF